MFESAFTCPGQGIFENTDSTDCKTFISCGSNLVPVVNNCNDGTYFWPAKKGCYSQYKCAEGTMPDDTDPCEGFTYNNIPDKTSTDCTKYLVCGTLYVYNLYTEIMQVTVAECPSGTAFRPGWGCISNHQCSNYQCTSVGTFANSDSSDCSTYVKCYKYSNALLYADINTCPSNTKFNPFLNKCDSFYNCNGIDPHGGNDPCSSYNAANPIVPDPYGNEPSSYIGCEYDYPNFAGRDDIILKKECPANTFFSPLLGKCYNNYDPDETCSKDPCSSGPGKYVNYKSGHCESFIECRDETKTFELYQPTYEIRYCPPGTRYTPETSECSRQYVCPTFPVNYCYPPIPTTTTTTTLPPTTAAP